MASQTEEHIDPVDVLAAVVQVHHLLIRFDHAFVGLSGTIARLTHTFQRSQGIPNFFERDDFLEMRWPVSKQRLVVHVRPHQFTEACRVVQASAVRDAGFRTAVATFFVAIASTYDNRPRSVHFILAKQVDPAIPSSGEWRRENCMIERGVNGRNRLHIPTELAVIATLRRLQPVFDYPEHEIAQGFTEGHPPPLPHDLLALHAECQVQLALDNLQCGSAGFLSRTAWQREVPRLMSAHEYAERSDRLRAIFMASTPASETGEKPLNRLVWEAAIMEADLCGAPADYASEEERNRAAKRHLAKLVLGWKDAVEMLGRLFSIPYPSVHDPLSRA